MNVQELRVRKIFFNIRETYDFFVFVVALLLYYLAVVVNRPRRLEPG